MGGKGSGRKKKTLQRGQLEQKLQMMAPAAAAVIEMYVDGDTVDNLGNPITKERIESAWKVVDHVKGRPGQSVVVSGDEARPMRATITVVSYEGKELVQRVLNGERTG